MRAVLVGRFAELKGQRVPLKAVAIFRKAGVDIELTLVGGGNPQNQFANSLFSWALFST